MADGFPRYKYRGQDPQHSDNRALRTALEYGWPLIWFWGVAPAVYEDIRPIGLVTDETQNCQFVLAVDPAEQSIAGHGTSSDAKRRHIQQLTRQRVHQPLFRAQVITAYRQRCAMCRLGYAWLLDAAHRE